MGVCLYFFMFSALFFHLLPAWLYHIFPHVLINGTIFGKSSLIRNYVLIFGTTFVWLISLSKKNSARSYRRCSYDFIESTRYSCQILIELGIFSSYCRKVLRYHVSWKSSRGNRVVPCAWIDTVGRTDMTKLIVAFRYFANAPKNSNIENILLHGI